MAHNAYKGGLGVGQYHVIPSDRQRDAVLAHKAFKGNRSAARSPYSANGIYDIGSNVFISNVAEIFDSLAPVPGGTTDVEGINGAMFPCTHTGPVTLRIGSVTRTFVGFYCPTETTTIVPGAKFDSGD